MLFRADIVYASLAGRYVGAYRDPLALSTGPEAGTFQTLGDVWHFDLHFSVDVGHWLLPESAALSGARFSLSVTNLLDRSEEHTSELQSLMRISYAVFCLKKKKKE